MENYIFCNIIAGEIPSCKVYEDDQVLAFLDILQTTKGHTLLVPKEHVHCVFLEMSRRYSLLLRSLTKARPCPQKSNWGASP